MAVGMGYEPVIHPPRDEKKRAFKKAARSGPPFEYLDRNRNIVRQTELLLATPGEKEEVLVGSGTWATIRFARKKANYKVVVIFPDGSLG